MKDNYKVIAILNIKRANLMTPEGKRNTANWLRKEADDLEKNGVNYGIIYTARYGYDDKKVK